MFKKVNLVRLCVRACAFPPARKTVAMPRHTRTTTRGDGGCFADGCGAAAEFGMACDGGWRPFLCAAHASPWLDQMVRMAYPLCRGSADGGSCGAIAKYGVDAHTPVPAVLCGAHFARAHGGSTLKRTSQSFCAACHKRANTGMPGAPPACAVLCGKHGDPLGFVDVVSSRCPCGVQASYTHVGADGHGGGTARYYCRACLLAAQAAGALPAGAFRSFAYGCAECTRLGVDRPACVPKKGDVCYKCRSGMPLDARAPSRALRPKGEQHMPRMGVAPASAIAARKAAGLSIRHATQALAYACHAEGCPRNASYGSAPGNFTHCASHARAQTAVDGIARPNQRWRWRCTECEDMAYYRRDAQGTVPTRCRAHVADGMVHARNRHACATCGVHAYVACKGDVCANCAKHTKRIKALEASVQLALEHAGLYAASRDAPLPCAPRDVARNRPDFAWRVRCVASAAATAAAATATGVPLQYYNIVLEVDENEHVNYIAVCEIGRLHALAESFGGEPLIVVRYNPNATISRAKARAALLRGLAAAPAAAHASAAAPAAAAFAAAAAAAAEAAAGTGKADEKDVSVHVRAHARLVALLQTLLALPASAMPPFGFEVHYMGYSADRVTKLHDVQARLYDAAGRGVDWTGDAKGKDAEDDSAEDDSAEDDSAEDNDADDSDAEANDAADSDAEDDNAEDDSAEDDNAEDDNAKDDSAEDDDSDVVEMHHVAAKRRRVAGSCE